MSKGISKTGNSRSARQEKKEGNQASVMYFVPPSMEGTIVRDNLYGCFTKSKAKYLWPPMALAQIAAVTRDAGIKSFLIDAMAEGLTVRETLSKLLRHSPDYVVVLSSYATYAADAKFLEKVKARLPDAKTIMCGNFTTAFPDKALEFKSVDFVTLGEPEYAVRDLILEDVKAKDKKDLSKVRGIAYMESGKLVSTGKSEVIENLDELPFPARELIKTKLYFNPFAKRMPFTTIMTSRGCPYNCTFCAAGQTYGKRFRARSPDSMVQEIEQCMKKFGIREILFRDETFTNNKQRVIDFCKLLLRRKVKITWICASRINTIDREMMVLMKKAGCHMIKYGVESGDQHVLNMMKKGITVKQSRQVFKWMNELSIDSAAHMVLGTPGETEESIKKTIKFVKEIDPTYASFNIATPYMGTEMYDQIADKIEAMEMDKYDSEKGLVSGGDYSELLCGIPRKRLEYYYKKIHREFHFRPRYILKRIVGIKSPGQLYRQVIAGISFAGFVFSNKKGKSSADGKRKRIIKNNS